MIPQSETHPPRQRRSVGGTPHGLELNPRLYACDLIAAQALRGLGRFDDAIRRLHHLLEIAPDDAVVQQELTQTLDQKRRASSK